MKIAITAKENRENAPAEERFGRAPYFILFDDESRTRSILENPGADAPGGVGPRTVQLLVNHDVHVVITGQVGGNAMTALKAAGIETYQYREGGTVEDALSLYREGRLTRIL